VTVRRVVPADWPQLKARRLEALTDTPIGFLETLDAAQALDDAAWQARAARGSEGGDSLQILAFDAGRAVGTSVSFLSKVGDAWLAAVYVTPSHRGAGLLARLVEPCAEWVRERGADSLMLEVHEDNPRARAAYARLGFVETGATAPYPLAPGGCELVMRMPV
jgi:GNAT superfamily N-acetyltransferase